MSSKEKHLVLASRREDDRKFFMELAVRYGMRLTIPVTSDELASAVLAGGLLVMDANDDEFLTSKYMFSMPALNHVLKDRADVRQMFALSDDYVYQDTNLRPPQSEYTKKIRHNLLRKYSQPAAIDVYGRMIDVCFKEEAPKLADYFPANQKIQKITLQNSTQRKLAVEALQNIAEGVALSGRLASKLAQGADELLMNAIFDAPRDAMARACRKEVDRNQTFELKDKDAVVFEMAHDGNLLGVSVTDFYGSLTYKDILRSLSVDYVTAKYNVKRDTLGAGLGLYQTTYNGVSTVYSVAENRFTRAMLLFPAVKSNLDFKDSFEFMSFYTA